MTSSEEEAGAHVWGDVPSLRLEESTPPDSPAGADTNGQAVEASRAIVPPGDLDDCAVPIIQAEAVQTDGPNH